MISFGSRNPKGSDIVAAIDLIGVFYREAVYTPYFMLSFWFIYKGSYWLLLPLILVLVVWESSFSTVSEFVFKRISSTANHVEDLVAESSRSVIRFLRIGLLAYNLLMMSVAYFAIVTNKSDFWFAMASVILSVVYLGFLQIGSTRANRR